MSIFEKLLGSGDVVGKGIDLIDSFHTSETEAIEAKTKAKTELLASYAPFKLAQRYLALIFSVTFVFSYLLVLLLSLRDTDITEVRQIITAFKIDWIMLTIVGFYFGGGALEGLIERRKKAKEK